MMQMPIDSESNLKILSAADYSNLPKIPATVRLQYGKDLAQFGDLYLPNNAINANRHKEYPVIILIHGGFWKAEYGLEPLGKLAQALTADGFAVWNIEYRRVGNGGGFPETFEDVANAAEFLRLIATEYHLDVRTIFSMGHSAGGHLALWLAARHRIPSQSCLYRKEALEIKGVIALAGVADLIDAAERNLGKSATQALLGGTAADLPERYAATSPCSLLPFNVPQWHIIGRYDESVPVDYLQKYVDTASLYGVVLLDILPDVGHFELVDPDTTAWETVRNAILRLLDLQQSDMLD